MKEKYTPGPWQWEGDAGYGHDKLSAPSGTVLGIDLSWSLEPGEGLDGQSLELSDADARLIAAAPEMLEALQDILHQYEKSRMMIGADLADSISVFGRQAITKATAAA
jgi:hypothetical protein